MKCPDLHINTVFPTLAHIRVAGGSSAKNFFLGTAMRSGVAKMTSLCRSGHSIHAIPSEIHFVN